MTEESQAPKVKADSVGDGGRVDGRLPANIETELGERLRPLVGNKVPEVIFAVEEVAAEIFSGPLPPPEMLRGYDEVQPGAAGRILAMAETEQAHRHHMEKKSISINGFMAIFGQLAGAGLLLVVFALAVLSAWLGFETLAATLLAVGTLGAVLAVIRSRLIPDIIRGREAPEEESPNDDGPPTPRKKQKRRRRR